MSWLSVVVPALNEAGEIEATLRAARLALGLDTELLVADGGSRDGTRERAGRHARVTVSPPGRGRQLNAGAREATSEILLFLHADTHLPSGARAALEAALADPGVVGGAFHFALHGPLASKRIGRLLQRGVNARCRLFRSATGDQAIFCRRTAFEAVGGYAEIPLFEDAVFYRELRRRGRVVLLPVAAATSDRRWRTRGVGRTTVLHAFLRIAYHAGVDPHRLARWYGGGS